MQRVLVFNPVLIGTVRPRDRHTRSVLHNMRLCNT